MKTKLSQHTKPSIEQKLFFINTIKEYYSNNARPFPWRNTSDPYHILISEIMLQQTQTDRVLEKYDSFIKAFPNISHLAYADLSSILALWQGLGYNRRALYLKKIAYQVVTEYSGKLPVTFDELIKFPGIGRSTAGAILAFAFNKPFVFIETNIRSVYIHFFFQDRINVRDHEILYLIEKTLDKSNPRHWYYALMDYGVMLKKLYPNPNLKSAHYTKQSPFEGSIRQTRGMILKILIEKGNLKEKELASIIGNTSCPLENILNTLEKDRLIKRSCGLIKIS